MPLSRLSLPGLLLILAMPAGAQAAAHGRPAQVTIANFHSSRDKLRVHGPHSVRSAHLGTRHPAASHG